MSKKSVSIVLGTYNRLPFLQLTIDSIRQELARCQFSSEIIVVDGGSDDGTLQWLLQQKDIVTIIQHNRGEWQGKTIERRSWGYFMNLGFECAQGKYICMLSDDCLVVAGAIERGYRVFETELDRGEKIGAVAFYWRNYPEMAHYWVGVTLGQKMFVNHGLYLQSAMQDVGYFNEDTYRFYCADGDACLKLWQQGYRVIESPESFIEHYSHANEQVRQSNQATYRQDLQNYLNTWDGIFYDPSLKNTGGWIEKKFIDNTHTAQAFERFLTKPSPLQTQTFFTRFSVWLKRKFCVNRTGLPQSDKHRGS